MRRPRQQAASLVVNIRWLALHALIGRASWFAALLLVARAVGAGDYGELTFYLALWLIVARGLGLGLDVWVNRAIAGSDDPDARAAAAAAAVGLRLVLVGVAVAAISLAVVWFRPGLIVAVLSFVLVGVRQLAESLREVLVGVYQGHERMRDQALVLLPWEVAQLAAVALLSFTFGVTSPVLLLTVLLAVSYAKVCALLFRLRRFGTRPGAAAYPLGRALREGALLGVVALLALAIGKIDVLLLRGLVDPVTVGNYALAYLFIEAADVLLGTVRQALFPRLTWLAASDPARFRGLLLRGLLFFATIAAAASGAVWLLQGSLLRWLLLDSYPLALAYLPWLSLALPFLSLAGALGSANISCGNQAAVWRLQLLGLTVNVALNLLLIPRYAGFGAVLATLLTYALMTAGHSWILRPQLRPRLHPAHD